MKLKEITERCPIWVDCTPMCEKCSKHKDCQNLGDDAICKYGEWYEERAWEVSDSLTTIGIIKSNDRSEYHFYPYQEYFGTHELLMCVEALHRIIVEVGGISIPSEWMQEVIDKEDNDEANL